MHSHFLRNEIFHRSRRPTSGAIRPASRYKIYIYFYIFAWPSVSSCIDDPFSLLERDAAIHDESRANHIIINILIIIIILNINININIISIIIITIIFSLRSAPSIIIDASLVNFLTYFTAHIITDTA